MGLSVCGFSHRTASLVEREGFQLNRAELPHASEAYQEISGCDEAVVVSTCNRVEFYQFTPDKKDHLQSVLDFYRQRGSSDLEKLRDICYCHQKTTAARHLFIVAAGLDSMVLGEDQVFHQLKEAYSAACSVGAPGKILHKLFHLAFQVGKKVRTETSVGDGPRSVPAAALEMYKTRLEGSPPGTALVIGVNEITEIILDGLTRLGVPASLANRTPEKAHKLAAPFNARTLPLEDIADLIPEVNVLFTATSAPGYLINRSHFGEYAPGDSPRYLIDLAIPRDVDPGVADLPGIVILDLQDVKRYLDHSESQRAGDVPLAESMVEEQVKAYSLWRAKLRQETRLLEMHKVLNKMRKAELERFKEGFHLSEYRALDAFSQALVKNFMRILPEAMEANEEVGKKIGSSGDKKKSSKS
jgi:glutamyl-tRNA reductase